MTTRTMIVFPTYIAMLMDVSAIELGSRKAWVLTRTMRRIPVSRDAFTPDDLSPETSASALALKAFKLTEGL